MDKEEEETNKSISSTLMTLMGHCMLSIGSLIFTLIFWVVGLIASFSTGATHDSNMTDCLTVDLN